VTWIIAITKIYITKQ